MPHDKSLLHFMETECDFSTEHADGALAHSDCLFSLFGPDAAAACQAHSTSEACRAHCTASIRFTVCTRFVLVCVGSFLDHLQFCFEYGSIHYKQHSPRVLYLHSIMGVGTNLFPMPMSKVFKPFQSILGYPRLSSAVGRVGRCGQLRAAAAIWMVERSASCVLWSPSSR